MRYDFIDHTYISMQSILQIQIQLEKTHLTVQDQQLLYPTVSVNISID